MIIQGIYIRGSNWHLSKMSQISWLIYIYIYIIRQKIYRKENTWNKNIILKVFSLHSLLAKAIHSQTTIKKLKGYLGVIKVRNWGWKDFIVGLFRSLPYLLRCTTTEVIKGNNRKLHFGFPTFSYSVSRKKNH